MSGLVPQRPRQRHPQRGAALLMAMLTVTLVAGFAAAALWQQYQAIEVESAERSRVQGAWVLTGSLDWARLILREDGRTGGADHLGEPWAVVLQESRLSSFLAADKSSTTADTQDQLDVFLSGQIVDMQSRMNVANLADAGKVSPADLLVFSRLFEQLGLPQGELELLALNVARAKAGAVAGAADASSAPLMPQRMQQLEWLGLSQATITRLLPFVCVLPERTPVNLNTAPPEVLFASIIGLEMGEAQRLVESRALNPFRTLDDVRKQLATTLAPLNETAHSVNTRFFEVRGRLRMEQTLIEERSLVRRDGIDVRTLWRERSTLPLLDNPAETGAPTK